MREGHYNRSLKDKYLKRLLEAELIEKFPRASYKLKTPAKKLIKAYIADVKKNKESKFFEKLVYEYYERFLKGRSYPGIKSALHNFSHTSLVEEGNKMISVHNLSTNDNKAIAYNNEDFKKGKRSDLVPEEYLTLLAYEIQKKNKISKEAPEIVNTLLSLS